MHSILTFLRSEDGSGAILYCCLCGCITAAIIGPLQQVGQNLARIFTIIAQALAMH